MLPRARNAAHVNVLRILYTLLLYAALPWFLARLWWRGRREPGYRREIAERFGYGAPRARNLGGLDGPPTVDAVLAALEDARTG